MKHLELLKRIIFLADRFQKYDIFDFSSVNIKINTLLENSELLIYVFNVLQIPYETFVTNNKKKSPPDEINFSVGSKFDLKIFYYLTFLAKEVFNNNIDIYISYATEPKGKEYTISFGSYITKDENFTNVSRPIKSNEITVLDIDNLSWEHLIRLFPNNNYSFNGQCTTMIENYEDDDHCDVRDDHDYDRDTFDALTDGQYGDYDDWCDSGGGYDNFMDGLGY